MFTFDILIIMIDIWLIYTETVIVIVLSLGLPLIHNYET